MVRTVHCIKLKKEAEGLAVPPLPGPKGQWVYDNVSQQAWTEWQAHQTRLINENHLNLLDPETRKYLTDQMDKFFSGEDYDKASGHIPKS